MDRAKEATRDAIMHPVQAETVVLSGVVNGADPQLRADHAKDPAKDPIVAMDPEVAVAQSIQGRQSSCPAR